MKQQPNDAIGALAARASTGSSAGGAELAMIGMHGQHGAESVKRNLLHSTRMKHSTSDSDRLRRFDRVVGTFHQDLYRYAVWLCRDIAIAENIVQEALLRAWRSLDSFREDATAKPWLLTIVRRENGRYFARKRVETVDIDSLIPRQFSMLARSDDADIKGARQAIFELEDDYREPLVLQVLIGSGTQEIAQIMGLSKGAVLMRLHQARKRIKSKIDDDSAQ